MARTFNGDTLIVASHNKGKVREIEDLLRPYNVKPVSVGDLGLPVPEETEDSFIGNANIKSLAAATAANIPALSDDSGLVVPALNGDPGVYSADWAGPDRDFGMAMQKVANALGVKDPKAYFACALSLAWPDGHVEVFEGRVHGQLVWPPRGDKGFGYDPMFVPNGHKQTFGELDPIIKHNISHRADAFIQLIKAVFDVQ